MAWRQQVVEDTANHGRQQAENFKGDRVWLNLKNIVTPRPSKKFAWLHTKYRRVKVIFSHVVELDFPSNIHPWFHVDMLKKAAEDPLPYQIQNDFPPNPINTTIPRENQQLLVEKILRAEKHR